jgi:hypothetical protein
MKQIYEISGRSQGAQSSKIIASRIAQCISGIIKLSSARQESGPGSPAEQGKFETFAEKEANRFRIQATDRSVSYRPT